MARVRLREMQFRLFSTSLSVVAPDFTTTVNAFVIEPEGMIINGTDTEVSRVLYTKQSVEKRTLDQGAAVSELIYSVVRKSYHRTWPPVAFSELLRPLGNTGAIVSFTMILAVSNSG